MSHIHLTSIDKAQQLNCTTGNASTLSAVEQADFSSDVLNLLLEDPWLTNSREPPSAVNYHLLTPPGITPRCATYIRKDLQLNPRIDAHHNESILSVIIDIQGTKVEVNDI